MAGCSQAARIDRVIEVNAGRNPLRSLSIRVFGIGGAGYNIIERLRARHDCGPHVSTYTVNRVETERQVDLEFASGIDSPLTSKDQHLISESVRPADYVILTAGLGGKTGTTLVTHFAKCAKAHGCKVVTVIVLPFSFEGRRIRFARKAAEELNGIADQVITFDLASLTKSFPKDTTLGAFFDYANDLVVQAILNAMAAAETTFTTPRR
jgi:cell division GTPase FtsZ